MTIETIHDSLLNGQRTQMTKQIDEYGLYTFWADYRDYLEDHDIYESHQFYTDACTSYHRIKNR